MIAMLFHWRPGRDTLLALVCGLASVGLSFAMVPLEPWPWASAIVRDLLRVFALGILLSALLIWPFFLAVGGVYDMLINSKVVAAIPHVEIRTLVLAVLFAIVVAWIWRSAGTTENRPARR